MINGIRKLIRFMFTAALLGATCVAFAEEAIEEVIVTGSYIKGSPEDAASPIQVISRKIWTYRVLSPSMI